MPDRGLAIRILILIIAVLVTGPAIQADWSSGLAAFQAGDLSAAEKEFQAIAEAQPDWYGGHLMLGQTLLRQKKAGAALPHLKRARELSAEPATAMALAQAAAYKKEWSLVDDALADIDPAGLEPKQRVSFYRLKGSSAMDQQKWTIAVAQIERAIQLRPQDADLHVQLAAAAKNAGRPELAISHYEAARRLEPKNERTLKRLTNARYLQAMGLEGEPQVAACQKAAAEGQDLLKAAGSSLESWLIVGRLHLCAGDHTQAEKTLAQAATREPSAWEPLYFLARSQTERRDWSTAEATLERLGRHRLEPKTEAKVTSLRGLVYEGLQRFDLAIEQYTLIGEESKIARAKQSLDIQRRNKELEQIQNQIDEALAAEAKLAEEEKKIAGRGHSR